MRFRIIGAALLAIAATTPAPTPAMAADIGQGFTLSGGPTLVSDYRYRGISLSDEGIALQGSLELGHKSGFYAGVWGSSLDDTPLYGDVEFDLYGGWRHDLRPGTSLDVGFTYYTYPGGDSAVAGDSDYFEPKVAITQQLGPVSGTAGVAWAPSQDSTGKKDNLYVWTGLSAPVPGLPLTVKGSVGYSDGAFAPGGHYWDWSVGVEASSGPIKLGLAYVDTDLGDFRNVDAGLVLSVGASF